MSGKVHCLVIIPLPKAVKSVWKCVGVFLIFFFKFLFLYSDLHWSVGLTDFHTLRLTPDETMQSVWFLAWSGRERDHLVFCTFLFSFFLPILCGEGRGKHKKHKYLDIFLPPSRYFLLRRRWRQMSKLYVEATRALNWLSMIGVDRCRSLPEISTMG